MAIIVKTITPSIILVKSANPPIKSKEKRDMKEDLKLTPEDIKMKKTNLKNRKIKTGEKLTYAKQENWKEKIRKSYKGILSDEQIEETIRYWDDFIFQKIQQANKNFLKSEEGKIYQDYQALKIEARLEAAEIIHKYAMGTKNITSLDLLEKIQRDILMEQIKE